MSAGSTVGRGAARWSQQQVNLGIADLLGKHSRNIGLILASVIWVAFVGTQSHPYVTFQNILVVGLQITYIGLGALGSAFLVMSGNVDLSIGSMFSLTAVVSAMVATVAPWPLAVFAGILLGGVIGSTNGLLVLRANIAPLVVTIGTMSVIQGIALVLTGGYGISHVPTAFSAFGGGRPLGIPTPVIALVIGGVAAHLILRRTTFGIYTLAIGGNRPATVAAGVNVRRTILILYLVNGLIVGLAATLAASRLTTASPTFGLGYEFQVLTAVILGGVAFQGGEGGITGVMLAVILLGVISSGLVAIGVNPFFVTIVQGSALVAAVLLDQVVHDRREHRQKMIAMREHAQ
jgi:ribose transport system permease protein